MNEAIVSAGGPETLICSVKEPSVESGNAIMNHGIFRCPSPAASGRQGSDEDRQEGHRAGPGNPPVIVDDTAILEEAARASWMASFDNNVLCVAEKRFSHSTTSPTS